jgi:hypothetical protein
MLDSLKLYGAIVALFVFVGLGGAVKFLWEQRAELKAELAQTQAEVAARDQAISAIEKTAQAAAERAVQIQPIRQEVNNAPSGGCVGPAVRAAVDGLRRLQAGGGAP